MTAIQSLTVGPIVGHTDTEHVRIWGRGKFQVTKDNVPRRCFGIARIRRKTSRSYSKPLIFKMSPNFDMSGLAIFTGLDAETAYVYQIGWFFSEKELDGHNVNQAWQWNKASSGEFVTASADKNKTREFVFGSCRYLLRLFGGSWFDDRGDKTFRSILDQKRPDKFLMIGDQIYADDLNFLSPDDQVSEFLKRYRDAFSQKNIAELMANTPTYMTLDDHEIEDNWPEKADPKDMLVKFPAAMHSYQVYQMSHSPVLPITPDGRLHGTPECYYYTFADGCCDYFVMDTRTERHSKENEIISTEQMQTLLSWLGDKSGRVKIVATSVPFFPDARSESNDKWSGFKEQRDEIIKFIQDKKIQPVLFLAGDVHCSLTAELDISKANGPALKIYSIISSAFYWPYPHMKRRKFQLSGHLASSKNAKAYKLGKVSEVFSGDNFSRVKVSPGGFSVEVFERKGKRESHIEISF